MATFDEYGNKAPMKILKNQAAMKHFGQYIVLKIDLQDISGRSYSTLFNKLAATISRLYNSFEFLKLKVSAEDASVIQQGLGCSNRGQGAPITTEEEAFLTKSLKYLAEILNKYYQKSVVILVDEYDCPTNSILREISDDTERDKALSLFRGINCIHMS